MASEKVLRSSKRWEDLGNGMARQIMGWDNQIMMVKVKFEKGAVGAEHSHFHSQTTYCESGKFEFTMAGEKVIVEPGDGLYIEPNMLHGALCLEPGILIDVFSPMREDFL
ncbi:Cupin domain-containing protein [Draconibacterium orientale]|uniref:Cupin n=1 Tax=Draconibacterium orientale TaxID=1168034 RepID=X5DWF8_9BACT|nr:cupin domain-containing protein [Draconibacterium orientale]AHW58596.1 cupin [Draconibacterium orientale]SET31845.1 Cupin domain-containing protein [Draconibacterium orientale]